jgi:hypothetical protein
MDTRKMYYAYHHYCRQWYDLKLYDKTLVQLKSSGNMRLIPDDLSDSLALLDDRIAYFNDRLAYFLEAQNQVINEGLNFFDYSQYTKANTDSAGNLDIVTERGFLTLPYQPPLLSRDPRRPEKVRRYGWPVPQSNPAHHPADADPAPGTHRKHRFLQRIAESQPVRPRDQFQALQVSVQPVRVPVMQHNHYAVHLKAEMRPEE